VDWIEFIDSDWMEFWQTCYEISILKFFRLGFFTLANFQKKSKMFSRFTKKGKIFFERAKKTGKPFWKKFHLLHGKKELFSTHKKPGKPSKIAHFSDVNAIAGNSRAFCGIYLIKPGKLCAKISDLQKPAKLQAQIAIKWVILGK